MTRSRQQFLSLVAALALIESVLALAVSLPLILDAGIEAVHTLLRLCQHAFGVHYSSPSTLVAAALAPAVLILGMRFLRALRRTVRSTRVEIRRLLAPSWAAHVPADVRVALNRLELNHHVDLVDHPDPFAFCHRFLRPRICVSTALCARLDEAALIAVLLHEDHHRRRWEPLRLALLAALVTALPLRGWLASLAAEARAEIEVTADAAALRRGGSAPALARAMLAFLEYPATPPVAPTPDLTICHFSPTEARIECLMRAATRPYPPLSWRSFAALGLALAVPVAGLLLLGMQSDLHLLMHPCL